MTSRYSHWPAIIATLVVLWAAAFVSNASEATTVYLFRHAEKDLTQNTDPPLTQIGIARALQYATMLQHEEIAAVFSTDTQRTRETARPIATAHNLDVQLYSAKTVNRSELLDNHAGQSIVVIGHSNTIPALANLLLGEEHYQELSEQDYDSVFIVDIFAEPAQVLSKKLHVPLAAK